MQTKFNYAKTTIIKAEVEQLAKKALRDNRYHMRAHWKRLGGFKNKDAPKSKPYKKVSQNDWDFLCDYFGKEDQLVSNFYTLV